MPDRFAPRLSLGIATLTIRPLPHRAGLVLAGDADITTRDALRAALAALPADGIGDIHLDLAKLRFIDLSCTRELIAFTERHPCVRLIAHEPPASLLRITALIFPQASITVTGRSSPLTGAAGSAGSAPGLAGDGHTSGRAGMARIARRLPERPRPGPG
jgi:STAS domain